MHCSNGLLSDSTDSRGNLMKHRMDNDTVFFSPLSEMDDLSDPIEWRLSHNPDKIVSMLNDIMEVV